MLRGVAFDLDGVLVDSEPFWQDAEIEAFAAVGLSLTRDDCRQTMGLRIDEAVDHWHRARGWDGASPAEVVRAVVDGVVDRIETRGAALPGALEAVDRCRRRGLSLAIATSSWTEVADAVLHRLGLDGAFDAVCSAADEAHGKPSPDVYRSACRRLGLEPAAVVAIEDSAHGLRAALDAGMRCLAVPDAGVDAGAFSEATAVLGSLHELDDDLLDALDDPLGALGRSTR